MESGAVSDAILAATAPKPAAAAPAVEKKKPGRPKKSPQITPVEAHGIVAAPANQDDFLEMVYANPTMFKKIFAMFKSFDVGEIDITFDQAGMKLCAKDVTKKSTIYVNIDGRCMNFYYCKALIKIRVKRDHMEKVLSSLGKNHHKITFILKDNYRSRLYVNIRDADYGAAETYEIETIGGRDGGDDVADDDSQYPLKFHFSSKHLKTRVNNIYKLSKNFAIQKIGDGPLQLSYEKNHNSSVIVYEPGSNQKIGLVSRLGDGECLSVNVCIEYIKPFTNSTIGEEVYIAVDKREKISFMTQIDKGEFGWAATIKIFTEISRARTRDDAVPDDE